MSRTLTIVLVLFIGYILGVKFPNILKPIGI